MGSKIASKITGLGVLLALYGVLSGVLYFFDYNLRILMWVDLWGPLVGWGIRGVLVVGGGALAFVASMFDKSQSPEAQAERARAAEAAWAAVRNHPRTQQVFADLARLMPVTFDAPMDAQTYRVRQVLWQDASYRWQDPSTQINYGPDDPRVTNAAFYLERAEPPQRVVVGQDLATRQVTPPQEAHPTTWSMMVGG